MSVFVDTSALYALLVSTEEKHSEIASAFRVKPYRSTVISSVKDIASSPRTDQAN